MGELVRLLWSAFVWHQAGKAILLEGRQRLIERWQKQNQTLGPDRSWNHKKRHPQPDLACGDTNFPGEQKT